MVPFERALGFLEAVHGNFSSIFTRFRDIATFVLQIPERHFFPTPPPVSPKFPHVPLRLDGSPFGYEERRCWADSLCN